MSWKRDLGFLALTLFAIISYFALALGLGIFQRFPVVHMLLAAAGAAGLGWALLKEFHVRRLIFFLLSGILTAAYTWYTLDYSSYETTEVQVTEGSTLTALQGLQLTSHRNVQTPILAPPSEAAATLLVFYRGFW